MTSRGHSLAGIAPTRRGPFIAINPCKLALSTHRDHAVALSFETTSLQKEVRELTTCAPRRDRSGHLGGAIYERIKSPHFAGTLEFPASSWMSPRVGDGLP